MLQSQIHEITPVNKSELMDDEQMILIPIPVNRI